MAKGSFIFAMNRRKAIAVTEAEEVTVELAKSAVVHVTSLPQILVDLNSIRKKN